MGIIIKPLVTEKMTAITDKAKQPFRLYRARSHA